jgi:hypothetical protein
MSLPMVNFEAERQISRRLARARRIASYILHLAILNPLQAIAKIRRRHPYRGERNDTVAGKYEL